MFSGLFNIYELHIGSSRVLSRYYIYIIRLYLVYIRVDTGCSHLTPNLPKRH